jgi:hypothetical protein
MQNIYEDGSYLKNNPSWHVEDSPWKVEQIIKIIERNNLKPKTICEIGCGAGGILSRLSERYIDINFIGYEISSHAFKLCAKRSRINLTFKLANLLEEKIDLPFDILVAMDVIEHVADYFGFLNKLKVKSIYKIFHIPLDMSVQTILRCSPIISGRKRVGHIHYFMKETALETLTDAGYEIIDYFYTGGSLELPNRGWKSNMLRYPRKFAFLLHKDLAVRILGGYSLLILAK